MIKFRVQPTTMSDPNIRAYRKLMLFFIPKQREDRKSNNCWMWNMCTTHHHTCFSQWISGERIVLEKTTQRSSIVFRMAVARNVSNCWRTEEGTWWCGLTNWAVCPQRKIFVLEMANVFLLCGHMATTILKKNKAYKLVKISQSDDDRGDRGEADQGEYAVLEDQKFERRSECFEEKSGTYEDVEGREERKEQVLLFLRR